MANITWKDELIRGLRHFGGEAHRLDLFEYILKTTSKRVPKTFVRTLQKELERLSKDSANYSGGEDIFYSSRGIGEGYWALTEKFKQ